MEASFKFVRIGKTQLDIAVTLVEIVIVGPDRVIQITEETKEQITLDGEEVP